MATHAEMRMHFGFLLSRMKTLGNNLRHMSAFGNVRGRGNDSEKHLKRESPMNTISRVSNGATNTHEEITSHFYSVNRGKWKAKQ